MDMYSYHEGLAPLLNTPFILVILSKGANAPLRTPH